VFLLSLSDGASKMIFHIRRDARGSQRLSLEGSSVVLQSLMGGALPSCSLRLV